MTKILSISRKNIDMSREYQIKGIGLYAYALFILLCEGSVVFGILYGSILTLVAFIIALIVMIKKGKIININFQLLFILIFIFSINNIINLNNGVNWIQVILFSMKLITICIFQSYVDMKKLVTVIIKCIFYICIISLITYIFRTIDLPILRMFEIRKTVVDKIYIFTFWHTFGWNVDFGRNSGPYWEPGLFACYIIVGLLLLMFSNSHNIKKNDKKIYGLILGITLLTTESTTGYIVMSIILIVIFLKIPIKNNLQLLKKYIAFILIILSIIFLINTPTIKEKLFTENSSKYKRTEDFISGIKIVEKSPVFGLGFKSEVSKTLENTYGNGGTSNGFIQGFYRMGPILFVIILYMYLIGSIRLMGKKSLGYIFWIVSMILMVTEPIQINSIFLILIFKTYVYDSNIKTNTYKKITSDLN